MLLHSTENLCIDVQHFDGIQMFLIEKHLGSISYMRSINMISSFHTMLLNLLVKSLFIHTPHPGSLSFVLFTRFSFFDWIEF